MDSTCPQCGAALAPGMACIDLFHAAQLLEIENPDSYYSVHHLSVPAYMLQHDTYTKQGWLAVRRLVERFLHEELTPEMARRELSRSINPAKGWSLTRGPKLQPGIVWSRTIAGVRTATAAHYCEDVRLWTEAVVADSAALAGRI